MAKPAESSQPVKLVRKSVADIQAYVNSAKFQKDAARSKAKGNDPRPADLKEAPEFGGLDPKLFRVVKEKITTRIDADVLCWLKTKPHYQTTLNDLLRAAMVAEHPRGLDYKKKLSSQKIETKPVRSEHRVAARRSAITKRVRQYTARAVDKEHID